ncbi:MAG: ISL3 family transposase, partial [Ktedonobacteraceae bacterium]|nr:ISL3 family transposase [Ktedonobacteraceae bacterium]
MRHIIIKIYRHLITTFTLPPGLRITELSQEETVLTIEVLSERPSAHCPFCGEESDAVHSRYQRRIRDLPSVGQTVLLHLTVRRFFCQNRACQRKIFTERLPAFVEPWAQMTLRLSQALQAIGLSSSGSLGTRLAARLGIATSWMTILCRIMELPTPEVRIVTEVGIDDFSFRRGRKFGTILVDLREHTVIDLLPERSAESAAKWLRTHPEIRYVSRDRGKDYAQAADEGAPQAVQISDRFHLMKNFVEAVEAEVSHCYNQLRHAHPPLPTSSLPAPQEWKDVADSDEKQPQKRSQIDKQEQFEQVKTLLSQGVSALSVAERFAIPVRRVYHWKAREDCPAAFLSRTGRTDHLERFEQAKALRLHGLSHKQIAERLGVGVRTVQRWLARESGPYCQPR